MALEGVELHHHGIRIDLDKVDESLSFYREVLGLQPDPGRPEIPNIPGFWMDCSNGAQIHLIGVDGVSPLAKAPDQDPSAPHVALGVPDIETAKVELERSGVEYWTMALGLGIPDQVFVLDPNGNMIELHQIDSCNCKHAAAE